MNSKVKIKKMTEEDLFSEDDSLRIRAKALDQCIDELETLKEKMQKLRERFEDFCAEECAICAMHTKDGCGLINDFIKKEETHEHKTKS